MKVIAHTSSHRLLVEATGDELAHLMGLSGTYAAGTARRVNYDFHDPHRVFPINTEIDVTKLWQIIEHERGRPQQIASTARNLRALADMLETVNQALPTPSIDEKKADNGAQPA